MGERLNRLLVALRFGAGEVRDLQPRHVHCDGVGVVRVLRLWDQTRLHGLANAPVAARRVAPDDLTERIEVEALADHLDRRDPDGPCGRSMATVDASRFGWRLLARQSANVSDRVRDAA